MKKALLSIFLLFMPTFAYSANVTVPQSTAYGQVLIGNAVGGNYTPVATSTLGIPTGTSSFSTSSVDYYFSQFRDWSVQGNGYLAPTTTRGFIVSASSTIAAAMTVSGTFNLSALMNGCLQTVSGAVTSTGLSCGSSSGGSWATSSSDYYASQFRDWSINSFGALAPTTTRGIFVSATSTIGDGTQRGGLTVYGGATTTANAYFGGNIGVGSTSPSQALSVVGSGQFSAGLYVGLSAGGTTQLTPAAGGIYLQRSANPFLVFIYNQTQAGQIRSNAANRLGITDGTGANEYLSVGTSGTGVGNVGVGTTTPWAKLSVNSFGGTQPQFLVASSTGSNATTTSLIVDNFGNVGIGTTSPGYALDVNGTVATIGSGGFLFSDTNNGLVESGGNTLRLNVGSGARFLIDVSNASFAVNAVPSTDNARDLGVLAARWRQIFSSATSTFATLRGTVGVGTTTPWGFLSVNSANSLISRPQFIVASSSAAVGTTTPFIITNEGLVGISTTSPYAMLSVAGSVVAQDFTATSTTATSTIQGVLSVDQGSNTLPGNTWFRVGSSTSNIIVDKLSGNTGIGTSSPFAPLSVTGATYIGNSLTATGTINLTAVPTGCVTSTGGLLGSNGVSCSTWATTSADYYSSQFRDWSLTGSPLYLAPTTSRAILVNNATSTITNLQVVIGTTTNATSTSFFATTASSTNTFGAGLISCNSASNAITWSNGLFGCNIISAGGSNTDKFATSSTQTRTITPNGGTDVAVVIGANATTTPTALQVVGTTTTSGLNITGSATTTSTSGFNITNGGGCYGVTLIGQTWCSPLSFSTTTKQAMGTTSIPIPPTAHVTIDVVATSSTSQIPYFRINNDTSASYSNGIAVSTTNASRMQLSGSGAVSFHLHIEMSNTTSEKKKGTYTIIMFNSDTAINEIATIGFTWASTAIASSFQMIPQISPNTYLTGAVMSVVGY